MFDSDVAAVETRVILKILIYLLFNEKVKG